jgi:hypothetical protein
MDGDEFFLEWSIDGGGSTKLEIRDDAGGNQFLSSLIFSPRRKRF